MRQPVQPDAPEAFLRQFFAALFPPCDHLRVAQIDRLAADTAHIHNYALSRDAAVRWLLEQRRQGVPNLYFAAGAHNGGLTYAQADMVSLPGFIVDLDAGKGKPFRDLDDVMAYLLTHPIGKASTAWVTGNGVQMLFRLRTPLPWAAGTPEAARVMQVWRGLNEAFIADTCDGPQHLFRVPFTRNVKPGKEAKEGYLLWYDLARTWTLDELEAAVAPWTVPVGKPKDDPPEADTTRDQPDASTPAQRTAVPGAAEVVPYAELPEDIRDEIEEDHANRSEAMFTCVARLARAGYNEPTIQAAIKHGPDFRKKYGRRLHEEVDRCLRKVTQSPVHICGEDVVPLPLRNVPTSIPLTTCDPLPDRLADRLKAYCAHAGMPETPEGMRDTARFHEHVVTHNPQGVLLAPCGAGKSSWALSHMAAHTTRDVRYIYVVETVDALYRAAACLEQLTDVPVGRVHAFNAEKCKELCGKDFTWKQCAPDHPKAVCATCPAQAQCAYRQRAQEQAKPIIVMTHAGFVRLIETGSSLLRGARVIVDEHLDAFADAEVSLNDLQLVQRYNQNDLPWDALFPYSRAAGRLNGWEITNPARTFAARSYTHCVCARTGKLATLYDHLRRMLATPLQPKDVFKEKAGDRERVYDVLATLVNILRPTQAGDATYAFTEQQDEHRQWGYRVRKQRFSLETEQPWASLWILNASAQLCPVEYPPNLPVFTCDDIPDTSPLLRLHVVVASPTGKATKDRLWLTAVAQMLAGLRQQHTRVMVATCKSGAGQADVQASISALWQPLPAPDVVHMTRGRIRGANSAGQCTLVIMTPMPLFTTVDQYALQAVLLLGRSLPRSVVFDPKTEHLLMPRGRFNLAAMQECYALGALDELYQGIWRGAVRNGTPTTVVAAIPDVTWMTTLWQTVMPKAQVVSAHRKAGLAEAKAYRKPVKDNLAALEAHPQGQENAQIATAMKDMRASLDAPVYLSEPLFLGLQSVINMPPGKSIGKRELAALLGYAGKEPWKENRTMILRLVEPWMVEDVQNVQQMVRLD